jgi:nucleoid-associated protein YgaU
MITVRTGDCLWSIARELARSDATDAAIAQLVGRLYAANRQVIGDDPDLIRPGTVLRAPGGHR